MTLIAKILFPLVLVAALGSTAWYFHTPSTANAPVATSTPETGMSTTTTTVTTTSTTTVTTKPAPIKPFPVDPLPGHRLTINSISPNEGPVGTKVTITGSGFTSTSQVMIGNNAAIASVTVNAAGTSLSFTMPSSAGAYCIVGRACPMYLMLIQSGTYKLSVRNTDDATSNSVSYTLTGESAL